jgi:hypothetical protein
MLGEPVSVESTIRIGVCLDHLATLKERRERREQTWQIERELARSEAGRERSFAVLGLFFRQWESASPK